MFRVDNLKFAYNKREILKGLSFEIKNSDVISILGPNGCGKTTLLKLLLGFLKPSSGRVYFENRPISKIKPKEFAKRVAYIPQIHQSAFGYLVKDVVLMGRMPYKSLFSNYNKRDFYIVLNALEALGIRELQNEIYTNLSGGQRQLVLIARAIAQEADIFIMDEPVNGLDFGNQYKLLSKIKELSQKEITFIKTSHYPDHVFFSSNEAIFIDSGEILAKGEPSKIIDKFNIKRVYSLNAKIEEFEDRRVCIAMG